MVQGRRSKRARAVKKTLGGCVESSWRKVAQAYIRRRLLAPGHLEETNGKQCDVRQEEEHDDEGIKVDLSYIDHKKRSAVDPRDARWKYLFTLLWHVAALFRKGGR